MLLDLVMTHPFLTLMLATLAIVGVSLLTSSVQFIRENEAGLIIKRFGRSLPAGRLVALAGEAGYQARLLSPGWHAGFWPWQYKVSRVPLVVVPAGEVALLVANDGQAIPSGRILGREVRCDQFQDAEQFLKNGGERGRQLGFLTAGTWRINPALFELVTAKNATAFGMTAEQLRVKRISADMVGIVTTLDGQPIAAGDVAGPHVEGHDSFQSGQKFIDAGGSRGLQEQVLLSGSWNLNPWLAQVDPVPMTEVPIGYVGVVVSYVGDEHLDVSGDAFTHGDLVDKGRKGVWVEPLLPGKHPINSRVMRVELVPTTNIVLNWATRTEAHKYDERLNPITVRSKDGFAFSLDVSQIIHIGMKNAPRVISRVGSMQNLVDHVLQPTVANYFRNSAQAVTVLEFLSARSQRQEEAFGNIKSAVEAYDIECIDTLIGDIVPPETLMKTQTDRKIAEELKRTYDAEREAQVRRQELERETAIANLQAEVVRSEQQVRIAERDAASTAERAKGAAMAERLRAEAEADALRMTSEAGADALRMTSEAEANSSRIRGEAEADAARAMGLARAEAYRKAVEAMGAPLYASMQVAAVLAENKVKLVPEISMTSGGDGRAAGLADVLIARMFAGSGQAAGSGPSASAANPEPTAL